MPSNFAPLSVSSMSCRPLFTAAHCIYIERTCMLNFDVAEYEFGMSFVVFSFQSEVVFMKQNSQQRN